MKQIILGALLAIGTPIGVHSAPAAVAPAAHSADALALATLMTPADSMTRISASAFDFAVAEDVRSTPAQQEFAAHPGMKDFVAGRVRDRVAVILNAELNGLRDQIAGALENRMTPQEIVQVKSFFESPTGLRMRKIMMEAMVAHPPVPGHEEDANKAGIDTFTKTMTADDLPALQAFGASSGAAKMQILNPEIAAISKNWGLSTMQAHAAELRAVADAARKEFLAKPKARGA